MVAVQSEPSTSTTHRKNRRKLSKKSAPSDPTEIREYDHKMDEDLPQDIQEDPLIPLAIDIINDDEVMITTDPASVPPQTSAPSFPPLPAHALQTSLKSEMRRVTVPPHRLTPLKKDWINIFGPLTEILGLQVRMNVPRKSVEIRASVFSAYVI